jgi:alkylated DNA repair dioxygenase AlkB
MNLFEKKTPDNLLPYDGTAVYYGKIIQQKSATEFYNLLMNNIEWRNDEAIILGKHIITKRKVAWYGLENFSYTYSKITKSALHFTDELMELKLIAESYTNASYNSCLLNLYHDGNEGMAWHSDGEKDLLKNGSIASMSFGAERKFCFKHKSSKQKIDIVLENGSLLEMKDETQTHWMHRLPLTTKVNQPRINLTFRTILQ